MRTPALAVAAGCAVATAVIISLAISYEKKPAAASTAGLASHSGLVPISQAQPSSETVMAATTSEKKIPASALPAIPLQVKETIELKKIIQEENPAKLQQVLVTGTTDTVLSFSNGTKITVDPGSFVNERTGLPVTAAVAIQVKEFYDLNQMMAAHLSTATKDAMLETNGMIYLSASSEGEACKLRQGGAMQVSFPVKNDQPGMELFSGEKDAAGTIIWKPLKIQAAIVNSGNPNSFAINKNSPPGEPQKIIDTTLNTPPEFPDGITGIARNINSTKNYFPMQGATGAEMVDIVISKEGKVLWVKSVISCSQDYFTCLSRAIYNMPAWKPALKKGRPVLYTLRLMVLFNPATVKLMKFMPCYPSPYQVKEIEVKREYMWEERYAEYQVRKYYSFATSTLGWINCDKFYNSPGPKTQLYVDGRGDEPMDVQLVFHNYNSLLAGTTGSDGIYYFSNVPIGEPVTVIALKGEKGHLQMAVKNLQVSNQPITGLAFKSVSADDIKATMEQFNSLFQKTVMR